MLEQTTHGATPPNPGRQTHSEPVMIMLMGHSHCADPAALTCGDTHATQTRFCSYVLAGHSVQAVAPVTLVYLPAEHEMQAP